MANLGGRNLKNKRKRAGTARPRRSGSAAPAVRRWRNAAIAAPFVAIAAITVAMTAFVTAAGAPPVGEVGRYGCYVSKGCAGPKFNAPAGFAVAATEEDDVYVLDRVLDVNA